MKLYADHVNEVGDKILLDLASAQKLLEDASADKRNNVDDRLLLARIVGATQNLRRHVGPFVALGRQVLAEYEAGRWEEGVTMLEKLKPYEDVFGAELAAVRQGWSVSASGRWTRRWTTSG